MIHRFHSSEALVEKLYSEFLGTVSGGRPMNIVLSGGNTPRVLLEKIATMQHKKPGQLVWKDVHLFWADERCVPPAHPESNYGMTNQALLQYIELNKNQVHRIVGENDPDEEAIRYACEIKNTVPEKDGIPQFDWIFLGVGEDGHTASIFPDRPDLLDSEKICAAVKHPASGQYRVTLTGRPIIQARKITFLVTGDSKSSVISRILNHDPEAAVYPAAYIFHHHSDAQWYLDEAAARQLNNVPSW